MDVRPARESGLDGLTAPFRAAYGDLVVPAFAARGAARAGAIGHTGERPPDGAGPTEERRE